MIPSMTKNEFANNHFVGLSLEVPHKDLLEIILWFHFGVTTQGFASQHFVGLISIFFVHGIKSSA